MTRALLPHPGEPLAQRYCEHLDCKLTAFEDLAFLGAEFSRQDIIESAPICLRSGVQVVCRRTPRKGPVHAPLPERREPA